MALNKNSLMFFAAPPLHAYTGHPEQWIGKGLGDHIAQDLSDSHLVVVTAPPPNTLSD
jgi:hypothetical protein